MRRALLWLALFPAAASAQPPSDWERENADRLKQSLEQEVPPPALQRSQLVEVQLEAASAFSYFVDASSLSVGADRIVRYIMVARTPNGVENVSFEGLRCPGEYRIYAVGQPEGRWGGRPSAWRPVPRDARSGRHALSRRYFCPARAAIQDAQEGVGALRAGGHPGSKQH